MTGDQYRKLSESLKKTELNRVFSWSSTAALTIEKENYINGVSKDCLALLLRMGYIKAMEDNGLINKEK